MGYTHSFHQYRDATETQWEAICADVRKLLEKVPAHSTSAGGSFSDAPLILCDGFGKAGTAPEVNQDQIWLNGSEDDDMMNETFLLSRLYKPDWVESWMYNKDEQGRKRLFQFCKTERKPYDLVVCACLIVAHHHAPKAYDIDTDGTPEDWAPALEWVSAVLGDGYVLPPKVVGRAAAAPLEPEPAVTWEGLPASNWF